MLFLKIFLVLSGPKNAKNRVKMPNGRLFEIEKKSEKTLKTQMRPIFFRDLHLISLFKYEKIKNMDFFDRVQLTHLTMVPKATPKGL
jgi:hypothetical protein